MKLLKIQAQDANLVPEVRYEQAADLDETQQNGQDFVVWWGAVGDELWWLGGSVCEKCCIGTHRSASEGDLQVKSLGSGTDHEKG